MLNGDDPSSSEEWEPLQHPPPPPFSSGVDGENGVTAQPGNYDDVDPNVEDVLRAVDDLLLAEGTAGATSEEEEDDDDDDEDEEDDPSPTYVPVTATGSRGNRHGHGGESPLRLRRRLKRARERLVRPVTRMSVQATRRLVTGSSDTRIRDYVVLPRVVRVLDKYTFTWGVLGMLLTEFVVLRCPALFRYYFGLVMTPLFLLRVVLFRRSKQQYFLLDYCYWVNSLAFGLTIAPHLPQSMIGWLSPSHREILWQVFFISSNGPLFFAMVAWNNSLVFHSVDKVTSTYLHLFPALLSWCERWGPHGSLTDVSELSWSRHVGYPMVFYAVWQLVYLFQTEIWDKHKLDADPELSTSLRYLTTAEKMAINRKTLKLCRAVGVMGRDETFSPPTLKVKAIFVALQALMSLITFLPVGLFYRSVWIHSGVVLAILSFSVYNGARYYIQVFSKIHEKRYRGDQQSKEEYVDTSAAMTDHVKKA